MGLSLTDVPKWVTCSLETALEGTHQAAVLQLSLQQAVQGERHDVIEVLHLQRVEMGSPQRGLHIRAG